MYVHIARISYSVLYLVLLQFMYMYNFRLNIVDNTFLSKKTFACV